MDLSKEQFIVQLLSQNCSDSICKLTLERTVHCYKGGSHYLLHKVFSSADDVDAQVTSFLISVIGRSAVMYVPCKIQ